jgi:nitroimidazol reductase NimA-like FMN-containing flavoprotein (pyridoxamine 5'-phosphate oxidase superfamily)
MRRREKEITSQEQVEDILERAQVGRLGTVSKAGTPMIKPVNFLYRNGKIYFHSALEGEKMDHLAFGSRVCFEVDEALKYLPAADSPCQANFSYRSVIIEGRARLIEDPQEKIAILDHLMEKYQPGADLRPLSSKMVQKVGVVEIIAEKMTGKEALPSQEG